METGTLPASHRTSSELTQAALGWVPTASPKGSPRYRVIETEILIVGG